MERAGESISTSISQSISDRCATPERCGVQVASHGESGKREPAKARRSMHRMRRRGGANVAAGSARSIPMPITDSPPRRRAASRRPRRPRPRRSRARRRF
ncbi:hypothetical protein AQ948_05390 [Burkholderia pseudomallei]|nr:hypothetical protein AQ948_05390 [Burkholderia pseudomallei]